MRVWSRDRGVNMWKGDTGGKVWNGDGVWSEGGEIMKV